MPILNSQQLWAERNRLADEQRKFAESGDTDNALILEGQINQLDLTLDHVLDEENKLRHAPAPANRNSFAERLLGDRNEFGGLQIGWKNAAEVYNDATVTAPTSPIEIDMELPAKMPSAFPSFADTLLETPAVGSVTFQQRGEQTGTPDTWGGVTDGNSATKSRVLYKWVQAVANKETVAGYVPVSKDSLADYDDLMDIINNDLLIDLNDKTNEKYWNGSSSTGIKGISNTTGIQAFTTKMGGKYYDAIRMMRTLVMTKARRVPTHVAVSPEIREAIDLYKTETGLYQILGDGNTYWGMQVVEDVNCPGILVYDSFAARRRAIHGGVTVEVGYYNDQFIKNELSILAEHTKALQVRYPDAFCLAKKTDLDGSEAA